MLGYVSSFFLGNGAIQAQDEKSRRFQTSLRTQSGTFDQAVAVSQKSLNDGLYYLFDQYEELRSINIEDNLAGKLDAKMQYSEISLPVNEDNYSIVVFYCHFGSGSLRLKDKKGNLGDNIDVAGWRFAFNVDYGMIDVPSNTSEYQDLKKKFNHPGEYDIRRLFLDFQTNKINYYREDLSDFKGHKWTHDERRKFVFLMSAWGDPDEGVMKDQKLSTLGYAISTNKPQSVNPSGPTFPPTSLKRQNYKYLAPGKTKPEVGLEKGGNNMLLYLEMTQNRSFPQEDILLYSGNFCAAGMEATTCISRDNFWDAYLLRNTALDGSELPGLLREFNYQLYAWQGNLKLWVGSGGSAQLSWSFGIGHNNPKAPKNPASHYVWTKTSATNWEFKWQPPQSYDKCTAWPAWGEAWAKPETVNKISFKPGDNKIFIEGYSKLWIKWHRWFFGDKEEESWVTVTWNTEIEMKSVKEGGLEMQLKMPTNPKDLFKINYKPQSVSPGSKNGPGKAVPDLKSAAEDAITKVDFNKVTTTLQNSLKSSARFVLPGGQVFHYKDPILNDNGDLLVEGFHKN